MTCQAVGDGRREVAGQIQQGSNAVERFMPPIVTRWLLRRVTDNGAEHGGRWPVGHLYPSDNRLPVPCTFA